MKKTINFFIRQMPTASVDQVVLVGDFHLIQGIDRYLEKEMSISCNALSFASTVQSLHPEKSPLSDENIALCMATILSGKSPEGFNLLPQTYTQLPKAKTILLGLVIANMTWLAFLMGCGVGISHKILALRETLKEKDSIVAQLNSKKNQFLQQMDAMKSETRIHVEMAAVLSDQMPLADLLYDLNRIHPDRLKITSLEVTDKALKIKGDATSGKGQIQLIRYIRQLEKLGYLRDLRFNGQSSEAGISRFLIKGTLTPRSGHPNP